MVVPSLGSMENDDESLQAGLELKATKGFKNSEQKEKKGKDIEEMHLNFCSLTSRS